MKIGRFIFMMAKSRKTLAKWSAISILVPSPPHSAVQPKRHGFFSLPHVVLSALAQHGQGTRCTLHSIGLAWRDSIFCDVQNSSTKRT